MVLANTEEHTEVKMLARRMDRTIVGTPDWELCIIEAVTIFLSHAREEENVQLPLLTTRLSPQENNVGIYESPVFLTFLIILP